MILDFITDRLSKGNRTMEVIRGNLAKEKKKKLPGQGRVAWMGNLVTANLRWSTTADWDEIPYFTGSALSTTTTTGTSVAEINEDFNQIYVAGKQARTGLITGIEE